MRRINFLYAVFASLLIFSFFNFHEFDKAKAGLLEEANPDGAWLLHQWVVVEAYELETGKDISQQHSSEVWHFLAGKGFVLFQDQVIQQAGEWEIKNEMILIGIEGSGEKMIFQIKKRGRNELLLVSKELKVRLLKLDDV